MIVGELTAAETRYGLGQNRARGPGHPDALGSFRTGHPQRTAQPCRRAARTVECLTVAMCVENLDCRQCCRGNRVGQLLEARYPAGPRVSTVCSQRLASPCR